MMEIFRWNSQTFPDALHAAQIDYILKILQNAARRKLRAVKNYSVLERISIVPVEPAGVE